MPNERYAPMRTDWALVRRLACELDERFRGARVQDAGTLDDGRPALLLWLRGASSLLCLDLFGSPPVVTVESGGLGTAREPTFARTLARVLRGRVVARIEARTHDRLLKITFRTRSRFGVDDEVDLYIELVPRFGNAVLVKDERVLAAAQEFDLAHSTRPTLPGAKYVLPPLPRTARISELLDIPPETSVLALLAQDRAARIGAGESVRTQRRRAAIRRRIDARHRKNAAALKTLDARTNDLQEREAVRVQGEHIYATLHELSADEREARKREAAELFARYRKLTAALPHIARRRAQLERERDSLEMLLWETDHAPDEHLVDIESAFASMQPATRRREVAPARRKRRTPLEWRTEHGSRVLVGRSPLENAELTFRVARPNDLWFHVRGAPGAHVILTRDDRAAPPQGDIAFAASLAAKHSRAAASTKVTVDYTHRKHVRKQPDAPPGLVFYTNAKSITVAPAP